ncbi:pentatricopeptide repeat-containing protein [Tanacetum coccineum]
MKLIGKSLHPNKALEIYNGIEDKLTKVHPPVCNPVLGCLIKSGKFQNSFDMFRRMKQDGLVQDVVTYSMLLSGCAKFQDGYTKATKLVQELKNNELKMDSVIYEI